MSDGERERESEARATALPVLVVEDEFLIAMDIEDMLTRNGCRVIGPAPTVEEALELIESEKPEAAVLDVNLRGRRVTPVAVALARRNIPFVVASAYGREQLDSMPALGEAARLPKPISERRLIRALAALVPWASRRSGRPGPQAS